MNSRLKSALDALRYDESAPAHQRANLLFAILARAALRGDREIETACEEEIDRIRRANGTDALFAGRTRVSSVPRE